MNKRFLYTILFIILLGGNLVLGLRWYLAQQELTQAKSVLAVRETNRKTIEFVQMFIKQVLKADKEIDFDTRLKLENAVRDLKDVNILNQWQKFTDSKTEADAQREVKNLLEMLVDKVAGK